MKKSLILLTIITAFGQSLFAQSKVNFSQQMAAYAYFFPELSGWHGGLQANLQYRNQWPESSANYTTYNANVDGYIDKIHSGVGLNIEHDRASEIIITNNVELNLSPKLSTQNGITFMPALSGKITNQSVDWSKLTFATPDPSIPTGKTSMYRASVGAGLGIVFKEVFVAAHVHDINQPNQSFFAGSESRLPRTYSFLAGRVFTLNQFSITPRISYHNQATFNLLTLSCNAQYRWIYTGISYNYNGSLGFALGAELMERMRLSYSYDLYTSQLGPQTGGGHEIALRVWLYKDRAKKQFLSNLPLM